jgi:plasmid maintenance system antidote protein VapI
MARKKAPGRFSLSAMLRDSINARGLTAYSIAQDSGVHVTIISRFLKGERGLTFASADRVIDALGIRYAEVGNVKAKGKRP